MKYRLEQYFEFAALGTSWRVEILAGLTTFLTMAYIIFVNPAILSQAGMPAQGVMAATCVAAGFASILMGAFARYPIALAPGMGLNAYFTFAVVKGMGVPWQVALGAVFLSGLGFLILTAVGIREKLVSALPRDLYAAIAAGIGLFIAFIGLRNAGVVIAHPDTFVAIGNLRSPQAIAGLTGLIVAAGLQARGIRSHVLVGIATATSAGFLLGLTRFDPRSPHIDSLTGTLGRLDIAAAFRLGLAEIVFVFLFVDLLDNLGTLVGVTKKAGLIAQDGTIPRVNRILFVDATSTMLGAVAGTSTVVSYIESSAGIVAGGRSGVTAIVTGVLFLSSIALAPLAGLIPPAATASALILVGAAMASHLSEIDWRTPFVALPAFVTAISIPLTFSIANGIALGLSTHTVIHLLGGKRREVSWFVYALTAVFAIRFCYLGAA
jgi:AGZA family xanthine/uracil permease-like MFS transporter